MTVTTLYTLLFSSWKEMKKWVDKVYGDRTIGNASARNRFKRTSTAASQRQVDNTSIQLFYR